MSQLPAQAPSAVALVTFEDLCLLANESVPNSYNSSSSRGLYSRADRERTLGPPPTFAQGVSLFSLSIRERMPTVVLKSLSCSQILRSYSNHNTTPSLYSSKRSSAPLSRMPCAAPALFSSYTSKSPARDDAEVIPTLLIKLIIDEIGQ